MKGKNAMKDDCIFCKLANGMIPTVSPYEDELVKVIFDAAPASKGHMLVLPKRHFDNLYELDEETAKHMTYVVKKVALAASKVLKWDGLNVLQNNGEAAGQTVMHYHTHLIPRYEGDEVNIGWKPGEASDMATIAEEISNNI